MDPFLTFDKKIHLALLFMLFNVYWNLKFLKVTQRNYGRRYVWVLYNGGVTYQYIHHTRL
jgi:hypothetical protein